jgi:hypothetical protein
MKLLCLNENSNLARVLTDVREGIPLETQAEQCGAYSPKYYSTFAESDFDAACYSFPQAFSLANGVVSFSLDAAKQIAELTVNAQSNEAAAKVMSGLSYDVYVAQSTLPAEQRIAKYQAAIDANNANALETEQREQAIYAAETIEEVNAIVYPDKAE